MSPNKVQGDAERSTRPEAMSKGSPMRAVRLMLLLLAVISGTAVAQRNLSVAPANEQRVALVIGNAAYKTAPLSNSVNDCCLSLLGSIQPSVIGGYLRQAVAGGGGDGLLSRFQLLVWPDVAGDWKDVDRWPDTEAKAKADATFERLDLVDPASIGATVEDGVIPYLRFDSDAQGLFSEWRAGFELRIRGGNDHAAFEAHLAKYRKLVPALALLIHLADSGTGAIGETSLLKALSWAKYLETHARRAYASVTQAEAESARALLRRIRRAEVPNPFVPRDVYLKHWACLSRPEEVHEAVRLLADLDYLRREEQATGGRPKGLIWINPKVQAA